MQETDDARARERDILVWDAPTRLFHWLLALLVLAAYVTYLLSWTFWHVRLGEAVLALVLFRVLWGFWGGETTRFAAFLTGPGAALRHLGQVARGHSEERVGHNPAGGWMIVVMLVLLLGETLTGVFVNNDVAVVGPLSAVTPDRVQNLITHLHRVLWDMLLAAIALHLLAMLFYAKVLRQDLVTPMITGWKRATKPMPRPRLASWWRAAWLLGCGILAAAALSTYL
jgi:cytochrome b